MIIKGIAASLPERRVSNEEVIDLVRHYSQKEFQGDLDRTLRILLQLLKRSGLIERRWCDRHESPIDHVAIAVREALSRCYLRRKHIELLIYVGVGRGFLEPGNSHMIANALGFTNAQCFDVVDACMSWLRALDMVDSLFKTGKYRNALIINAEFHTFEGGPHFPDFLTFKSEHEIPYSFSSLTIGEAATATVLYPRDPQNFEFHFSSKPELSSLCTIPIAGYEEFCHPSPQIGKNGLMQFTAFGESIHRHGKIETAKIFREHNNKGKADIVFVHSSSKTEWDEVGRSAGVEQRIFHTFPATGNLVSASIPTAMHEAIQAGKLERGMSAAAWAGSAGMSFCLSTFRF